jgi:SNF2 family DNA or RNA helicase
MGLGKTLQTLCFLRLMMQTYWKERCKNSPLKLDAQAFESERCKHPILIVVTPILLDNFEKQAHDAFENARDFKFLQLHGKNIRDYYLENKRHLKGTEPALGRQALLDIDKLSAFRCIVITYDTLVNYQYSLAKVSWSVVLCDEVQKAKAASTNVSQSLKAVASKAIFTLLMSGTPIENDMNELWNIMDTAVAGLLGSLTTFRKTYKPFFHESDTQEKEKAFEELNQALKFGCFSEGFANGRLKEKVAQGLPQKIETDISVKLQPETIEEIRHIYKSDQTAVQKIGRIKQLSVHPFLYQSFQAQQASVEEWIQASHRLQRLEELLKAIAEKQEKALIFCEWHLYQNIVQDFVNQRYGKDLQAINSQVLLEERQAVLARFQETKGFSALVLSPKCAGMGLNLQEANHVIHLTRWWNPAVEDQATCRAYRTGQKKDVFVYYFVAEHAFEQNLNERIKQKRALRSNLFDLEYVTPIKPELLLSQLASE